MNNYMMYSAKTQDEQLLNDIIERNYFQVFQQRNPKNQRPKCIELFLLDTCLQHCKYCYLKNLPISENSFDYEKIIYNLNLILDWYIQHQFYCDINIFSGEWITTPLCDQVFQSLFNKFKDTQYKPYQIIIPDNMSFIENDNLIIKIQNYIDQFHTINIKIIFSASVDGYYCEIDRKLHSEEFYNKLFTFMEKNNFLAHPMLSSYQIENWKKNYAWWQTNAPKKIADNLMILEVRDQTWTQDKINTFLEVVDFIIDYKFFHQYNQNKLAFIQDAFCLTDHLYWPGQLASRSIYNNQDFMSCSIQNTLTIKVPSLELVLCHRLAYPELLIGTFNVENNQITNIKENNVSLQVIKDHIKFSCLPHCETCRLQNVCIGFCLGNSYENYTNFLIPVKNICNFHTHKICFLFKKYEEMGLFEYIEKHTDLNIHPSFKEMLFNLRKILLEKD